MNNFDRIAPVFDKLVHFIFGNTVHAGQTKFLERIDDDAKVLILGGGTGWLLAELTAAKPNCTVVYIDASKKMIEMSKRKLEGMQRNVSFIHGTAMEIPAGSSFNTIITHFYLDLFEHRFCQEVCGTIRGFCHPESRWLACDFVNAAWWHGLMLRIMYLFFRMTTNLQTRRLPDWRKCIQNAGFLEIETEYYCNGFICSAVYRPGSRNHD